MTESSRETVISNSDKNLASAYYLFFLCSRQAMFAGFYLVVAIHFSTCYYLISKGGFLAAIAFFVLLINSLLCIVFVIWDLNYIRRLKVIHKIGKTSDKNTRETEILRALSEENVNPVQNTISKVLITGVGLFSLLASVALFILFTNPYLNRNL